MQIEDNGEIYATQGQAAKWFEVSITTIKNWKGDDKLVLAPDGASIALRASERKVNGISENDQPILASGEEVTEQTDERTLDRLNKFEDYRAKRMKNDLEKGHIVKKADLLPFFRNYSKQVNREFDSIEGQLDGTLIECSNCDHQTRLDGRGRQRIRETVIRIKNHLDDLHNNLEEAKA